MFQRFASVLFGDEVEEVSRGRPGEQVYGQSGEEEEEWILVDYLSEACSNPCGASLPGDTLTEGEEGEEDLVMIPSPIASPPLRYASCTSLDSTFENDGDRGPEEVDEVEEGFLRLEACSMEESWFVTPPPCFTGRGSKPILLETSPLENLLIEHPSMSVYTTHHSPRLTLNLPRSLSLDLDLGRPSTNPSPSVGGKDAGIRSVDSQRHRPDVAIVQRCSSFHSACYTAALSAHPGILEQPQQPGRLAQPHSRNTLRRLNLLRHAGGGRQTRTTTMYLHQPGHRHLNY